MLCVHTADLQTFMPATRINFSKLSTYHKKSESLQDLIKFSTIINFVFQRQKLSKTLVAASYSLQYTRQALVLQHLH